MPTETPNEHLNEREEIPVMREEDNASSRKERVKESTRKQTEALKKNVEDPTGYDDEALRRLVKNDPDKIEMNFDIVALRFSYEDRAPAIFYHALPYIKQCPSGDKMIRLAVELYPEDAFRCFSLYREVPDALYTLGSAVLVLMYKEKKPATYIKALIDEELKRRSLTDEQAQQLEATLEDKTISAAVTSHHIGNPEAFLQDPALMFASSVREEWIDWARFPPPDAFHTEIWKAQTRAMIARNLYFKHLSVTKEHALREFETILSAREKFGPLPLFKGRNVVHAAHTELVTEKAKYLWFHKLMMLDLHRFGSVGVQKAIKRQRPEAYTFIRAESNDKDVCKQAKKQTLERLLNTPPPMTFLLEGHGNQKGISLNEDPEDPAHASHSVLISADELSDVLEERVKKFPQLSNKNPSMRDVVILGSCYSSDFVRNILTNFDIDRLPKPNFLAMTEYGQFGFSAQMSSPYRSSFHADVLKLAPTAWWKHEKNTTTFDDVFENEFESYSNPTLYISDDDNITMQITENQTQRKSAES